jgi:hypothetical protein
MKIGNWPIDFTEDPFTGALHGPKRRLDLGHGCAQDRSTALIVCGKLGLPGCGQGVAGQAPIGGLGPAEEGGEQGWGDC